MDALYVQVRSSRTDDRVALYEQNPAHPGGEIFIAGQDAKVYRVATTPEVLRAVADARLVILPDDLKPVAEEPPRELRDRRTPVRGER